MKIRFLSLAALGLATTACNGILGITSGTSSGTTGAGGETTSGTSTGGGSTGGGNTSSTSSTSTGGSTTGSTSSTSSTSSLSTGGAGTGDGGTGDGGTGGTASTGGDGGGPCSPAGTATCNGAVLEIRDATGHSSTTTCDAVAACDAPAQKCNDFLSEGRLGVGAGRACVIEDDQSVKCWGANISDSTIGTLLLGEPLAEARRPETVDGVTGARQISVSYDHQCVLQDGGTVTCWGDNYVGQLGFRRAGPRGRRSSRASPGSSRCGRATATPAPGSVDGSVQCFGDQSAWLGPNHGAQPTPTAIGITGAVALRLGVQGYTPSCALLASGGVTCWDGTLVPTAVPGVTSALEVAVGWEHVFVRDANGVSWSIAATDAGGKETGWQTPTTLAGALSMSSITAGDAFCGLRKSGIVSCAKLNQTSPPSSLAAIASQPAGTVIEVASGGSRSYDGFNCLRILGPVASHVYCWGDDVDGELGTGAPEDVTTPASPSLSGQAALLTAGTSSTTAVLTTGAVALWGEPGALTTSTASTPATAGFLGTDNVIIRTFDELSRAYVVKKSGAPLLLSSTQSYPGTRLNLFTSGTGATFIDAFTFWHWDVGLQSDGTVVAYVESGSDGNQAGVLGNGTTTAPTSEVATTVPLAKKAAALAAFGALYNAGDAHVCVIESDNTVWCWGSNGSGELGIGTAGVVVSTPTPAALPSGETAVTLAAGDRFTCASTNLHHVYCWGDNSLGQNRAEPRRVVRLAHGNRRDLHRRRGDGGRGARLRLAPGWERPVLGRERLRPARRRHLPAPSSRHGERRDRRRPDGRRRPPHLRRAHRRRRALLGIVVLRAGRDGADGHVRDAAAGDGALVVAHARSIRGTPGDRPRRRAGTPCRRRTAACRGRRW